MKFLTPILLLSGCLSMAQGGSSDPEADTLDQMKAVYDKMCDADPKTTECNDLKKAINSLIDRHNADIEK